MYVQHLTMSRFRCFQHGELSFRTPTDYDQDPALLPNVTLLVGTNGAGKTSILKAIALGLLSPTLQDSGFRPRYLVRRTPGGSTEGTASVTAHAVYHWQDFGDPRPNDLAQTVRIGLDIERIHDTERLRWREPGSMLQGLVVKGDATSKGDDPDAGRAGELGRRLEQAFFAPNSPACFLVAYGATRRVESSDRFDLSAREKSRSPRYQRVASLFEDHVALTPFGAWFDGYANKGRRNQVASLLNGLLPSGCRFTGEKEGSDYLFDLHGARLPFDALSDGYRAYIGWVADMLYHICMGCPTGVKLNDYRGVILVDEIDLHLHPGWQREVMARLSRTLPLMQFVLTTHSPIVAGSTEPPNVRLLRTTPAGAVTIEQSGDPLFGLNATQVLESPYFGMATTRAPRAVESLKHLAKMAEGGKPDAGIAFLKALAGDPAALGGPHTAESPAPRRGRPVKKSASKRARRPKRK